MPWWVIVTLAGGLLVLTLVPGVYLWWPSREDPLKRTDLGLALMAGAVIAFSIFALQAAFDIRLHNLEERREDARREADRNASALSFIGLYDDLSFIDLSGRQLPGLYLRGKTLFRARLADANLRGAVLARADAIEADFRRATLTELRAEEARFDRADLTGADARDAVLVNSSLRNAVLKASDFESADLASTNLAGADLRGANFAGANLQLADLSGATYDSGTLFPRNIDLVLRRCARGRTCVVP